MPKNTKKEPVKKTVTKKATPKKEVYAAATPMPLPSLSTEEAKKAKDAAQRFDKAVEQLAVQKSEAEKIWEEIESKTILMFALPNQIVRDHCKPVTVEPSKLYLTIRSSATLPSLEAALGPNFSVEMADKFVIVSRTTNKK